MPYGDGYLQDCDQDVLTYDPDCCVLPEGARTRSVALIKLSYLPTLLANPTSLAVWNIGKSDGKIIVIPQTNGSYDSGLPQQLKGYGRRQASNGPRTMQLNFSFRAYLGNSEFMDILNQQYDWAPAWRTESLIYICEAPGLFGTRETVPDDVEGYVDWSVTSTIRSQRLPRRVDGSGLENFWKCTPTGAACLHTIFSNAFSCAFG